MISLIKLSENDKRFLISLILVILLFFVIIGYIGLLIERVMKYQSKKASEMMNNVVRANIIKDPVTFRKFGLKKNTRLFFQQSWLPFCILLFGGIIFLIYCATRNFDIDILDYNKKGITTIMFLWNDDAPRNDFFGAKIISGWPSLKNTPHWEADAWGCYILFPILLIVGTWYLVLVQAFIARQIKIYKLSKTVFVKNLDNYNSQNTLEDKNINKNNAISNNDDDKTPLKPL